MFLNLQNHGRSCLDVKWKEGLVSTRGQEASEVAQDRQRLSWGEEGGQAVSTAPTGVSSRLAPAQSSCLNE